MKIRNLKNYGIPSYILNIWEKHYSPCLLPLQEEAVKKYGVLDYGEGSTGLPRRFAPRNDKKGAPRNDRDKGSDGRDRNMARPALDEEFPIHTLSIV